MFHKCKQYLLVFCMDFIFFGCNLRSFGKNSSRKYSLFVKQLVFCNHGICPVKWVKSPETGIESVAGSSCTQFCANRFPTGLQPADSQFSLRKNGETYLSIYIRCKDESFHVLFNQIFERESRSFISMCMNIWNWHFVSEPEEMKWNFSATLHFLWTFKMRI